MRLLAIEHDYLFPSFYVSTKVLILARFFSLVEAPRRLKKGSPQELLRLEVRSSWLFFLFLFKYQATTPFKRIKRLK